MRNFLSKISLIVTLIFVSLNAVQAQVETDTCGDTDIKKARKLNPEAKIIVVGCYAQTLPEKIAAIKGVSLILGNKEKYSSA